MTLNTSYGIIKKFLMEGKTVFDRHYFDNGVIFTKDLLSDKTNTQSFRAMKEQGLKNFFGLDWLLHVNI